jgi:hypothetical protein
VEPKRGISIRAYRYMEVDRWNLSTIEDLILPYIVLEMNTFQLKVSTERDVWTNPAKFKSFATDTYRTRTHPVFLTPFEDMDPLQNVKDDECRALAVSFLEDIERSRNVMSEENIRDLVRDFGFLIRKETTLKTLFTILRSRSMDARGEAAEDEESDGKPSTNHTRQTQPDADIHDAKTVCLKSLGDVDIVRMFSCAFEDFSKRVDIESLF